jgi:hypothetical protein
MTAGPAIRRTILVLGVIVTLGAAAVTVQAASLWTAASAPLAHAPTSVSSLQLQLAQQVSRSAILEDQLAAMRASSDDLAAALNLANNQVSTDQATADQLRASLAAAQAKLAKLEASLKAASARPVTSSGSAVARPPVSDDGGIDD